MSGALIDEIHFNAMTGGDKALQAEVLGLFRDQAERWRESLTPEQPVARWRDAAHTLKGSAKGIGLWPLAEACEAAEAAAKTDPFDPTGAAAALERVRAVLAAALSEIAARGA